MVTTLQKLVEDLKDSDLKVSFNVETSMANGGCKVTLEIDGLKFEVDNDKYNFPYAFYAPDWIHNQIVENFPDSDYAKKFAPLVAGEYTRHVIEKIYKQIQHGLKIHGMPDSQLQNWESLTDREQMVWDAARCRYKNLLRYGKDGFLDDEEN